MNIFYLSECPVESAQAHCDKHVVKRILESAQMLCTAHMRVQAMHSVPRSSTNRLILITHQLYGLGLLQLIMSGWSYMPLLYAKNIPIDMVKYMQVKH